MLDQVKRLVTICDEYLLRDVILDSLGQYRSCHGKCSSCGVTVKHLYFRSYASAQVRDYVLQITSLCLQCFAALPHREQFSSMEFFE